MPREKESYRDNLERIDNKFPEKEVLKTSDVMKYTGLSRGTVVKRFTGSKGYVSKPVLARLLS